MSQIGHKVEIDKFQVHLFKFFIWSAKAVSESSNFY